MARPDAVAQHLLFKNTHKLNFQGSNPSESYRRWYSGHTADRGKAFVSPCAVSYRT